MLQNVHVKNLALIEETEIVLNDGFNILTGETGAGKSIIIDSINCCLGARTDKDFIREGADSGMVELIFTTEQSAVKEYASLNDIPVQEDNSYILSRRLMAGRSIYRINGVTVTAKQMKEMAVLLIDIHGQHEHQSLLLASKQAQLLDSFLPEKAAKVILNLKDLYKEISSVQKEIESFSMDQAKREREIALARYEVDEIENAGLVNGELEELEKKHRKMQGGQKILEYLGEALNALDGDGGVLETAGYIQKQITQASGYDQDLQDISSHFADAEQVLADSYHELKAYMDEMAFDPESFDSITERLDVLNTLCLKYGNDIPSILEYAAKRREELEKLLDADSYLDSLKVKLGKLEKEYKKSSENLHEYRKSEALRLSEEIAVVLKELNFLKVEFKIEVNYLDRMTMTGQDEVQFMISLNPGEKMKPINQVASGGELSRIMLALKTVLATRDNIETLIFDEIDTGISGATAWQVSKCIGQLSKTHQIICITHLPQIAAMADTHFKIEKQELSGKTRTDINEIKDEARAYEIARLASGDTISEAALLNAKNLIEDASAFKFSEK